MNQEEKELLLLLQKLTKKRFTSLSRLPGGFNCDVYAGTDEKGKKYFIKHYKKSREFPEKRLTTEFTALTFLRQHGLRHIPEPLSSYPEELIGIYEFVEGTAMLPEAITEKDVQTAVEFWQGIDKLKHIPEAQSLPEAKEACFRISDYQENVDRRLSALETLSRELPTRDLNLFLRMHLLPLYHEILGTYAPYWHKGEKEKLLPAKYRILSSSDFGFHNALRKADGTLIFHDFEYFGWDDPAKMIADFFLHPRMQLPYTYRETVYDFVSNSVGDTDLGKRLAFVYLILGLKWCLIMLNTFKDPETIAGRNSKFAAAQLTKAQRYLQIINKEFSDQTFPVSLATIK